MIDEKTDAEFVAECEKTMGTPNYGRPWDLLSEAIERLKRANAEKASLLSMTSAANGITEHTNSMLAKQLQNYSKSILETCELRAEIAELKTLLGWCVNSAKHSQEVWDYDDEGHTTGASEEYGYQWSEYEDCPEKARIEEILKETK